MLVECQPEMPISSMHKETVRSHNVHVIVSLETGRSYKRARKDPVMRKGDQTRQEIIRKAAPIFNQRGFDGAALSDLMRATGLEKGGIYRHFESKQQLAGEAFDYAWRLARDARLAGTQKITNTVDRLKRIIWNFRARRAGLVRGGCPLLNTSIDSDDGNLVLR